MMHGTGPVPGDARLDRLIAEVLAERAEDVYVAALPAETITERIAARPRLAHFPYGARLGMQGGSALLVVVALLMLAAVAAFVVGSRPAPSTTQLTVIRQLVDAVNARDLTALRSSLTDDGVLEFPWVRSDQGREGEVFMGEIDMTLANGPEVWIGFLDAGAMEAQLGSCHGLTASTMRCAVATRWRTLQVEIGESWMFEFDGQLVTRLEMGRVDPDPRDRVLPLGLADLASWEAWLRETYPEQAERLLPSGPDLFGHMYFRFGPGVSPEQIGESIREYLESRP